MDAVCFGCDKLKTVIRKIMPDKEYYPDHEIKYLCSDCYKEIRERSEKIQIPQSIGERFKIREQIINRKKWKGS